MEGIFTSPITNVQIVETDCLRELWEGVLTISNLMASVKVAVVPRDLLVFKWMCLLESRNQT